MAWTRFVRQVLSYKGMKDLHRHVSSHHSFMYLWLVGAALVFAGLGYSYLASHPEGVLDNSHEGEVRAVVSAFGNELNSVSLLGPDAAEQIQRAYGPYVAPELLAVWTAAPEDAPGRVTSSPWPSHIEIDAVTEAEGGAYEVTGRVLLVTSTSDAGSVPVTIRVASRDSGYKIVSYAEQGAQEAASPHTSTFTLALHEIGSTFGTSVTPLEVIEDSRCPMDAMCIQQGQARVRVQTVDGMGTSTAVITLAATEPITTEVASLWLTEVMPYPMASDPTEPEQYRFTFRVEAR